MRIPVRTVGHFTDAIEDPYGKYDICPGCGNLKTADHEMCVPCAARQRAEEQAQREEAELEQRRSAAHAFYRDQIASGWSPMDCWRHAQEQRKLRGDPPRPRFWTGQSIGRPK